MSLIRAGMAEDLGQIAAIQSESPEAAQWNPADYLGYRLWVLTEEGRIAGFLAARETAPGECELLNLAVAPAFRRRGVARRLVEELIKTLKTGIELTVFLEVRESNEAARAMYKSMNFKEVSTRPKYYTFPPESAIVMKFHSC
jgi:ribosomal-protein-alanine N-acetyltransferase